MMSAENLFPHNITPEQVRNAISGIDGFALREEKYFDIAFYNVVTPESFLDPREPNISDDEKLFRSIRRECRGIIFDKTGKVISRSLHKFFNVNEKTETQFDKIDLTKKHVILDKLDGSMIRPIPLMLDGRLYMRWGTKKGFSEVSLNAERFIASKPQYDNFARGCHAVGVTPIFEWWCPENSIVLKYAEPHLTLIAIRDNVTGDYWSHSQMVQEGIVFDIPVVPQLNIENLPIQTIVENVQKEEDIEGYIVRFDNGHMVKIKTEWYVTLHRSRDALSREKNIITWILTEKLDDVLPFIEEKERVRVIDFQTKVFSGLHETYDKWGKLLSYYRANTENKKEFAIGKQNISDLEKKMILTFYDREEVDFHTYFLKLPKVLGQHNFVSTQKNVDEMRHFWGNHKWNFEFFGEE